MLSGAIREVTLQSRWVKGRELSVWASRPVTIAQA